MLHTKREFEAYDPGAELSAKWPGWKVSPRPLEGIPEVWSVRRKTVLLDEGWYGRDPDMALAHVLAHLDLGHHLRMPLAARDEADADGLAMLRLDRIPDWVLW